MKLDIQLQKSKASLLRTVKKMRKEPAVAKNMQEPLHSTTLYKSGDATMTDYQGKAKKYVVILSTLHTSITVADNPKKIPECQSLQ